MGTPDTIEQMYTNAHAAIRADPAAKSTEKEKFKGKRYLRSKLSLAQRETAPNKRKMPSVANWKKKTNKSVICNLIWTLVAVYRTKKKKKKKKYSADTTA